MSVIVKGLDVPKNCYKCDYPLCGLWARHEVEWQKENRDKECPIIVLPPHGRLIDADGMVASVKRQTEIMREIAKEVDKLKPIANSKELDDVDIVAIAETVEKGVLQEIANAPTILEAEVEE